jgi:hypothetical protein
MRVPLRLKPFEFGVLFGTAEAVPLQTRFVEFASGRRNKWQFCEV